MSYRVIIGLPHWHFNGPSVFAERLVRGLVSMGHEANILLTESGSDQITGVTDLPVPEGLPCERLPAGRSDSWGSRWEALERYLEEQAPCNYLMLHDWRNNIIAPRLSNRVKIIGLIQADSELEMAQARKFGPFWNAIVPVSDPIRSKFITRCPHFASRTFTIRNAVPALRSAPIKSTDGPLLLAYSGELRPNQKRLDDLIEVAMHLAKRGTDFRLTLFGDGTHREYLQNQARELIAQGFVTFVGLLKGEDLLDALSKQHVIMLTSEYEGLSIALLEAMSRGCVPVVTRLSSQVVVIRDGINSLTAEVGDIHGFVSHLERLALDRSLLAKLSDQAFKTITEDGYTTENMMDRYLSLFRKLNDPSVLGKFKRSRRSIKAPEKSVAGESIFPGDLTADAKYVNNICPWPDSPKRGLQIVIQRSNDRIKLEDHKVLIASTLGAISGVDVFSNHLVRGLRARGINAMLHGHNFISKDGELSFSPDLPIDQTDTVLNSDFIGWRERWRRMIVHLESLAPCIYLPNYDYNYSCISPLLSEQIRVVGIAHSDDPDHYDHLARIGNACDALIGVSGMITRHLRGLLPQLTDRLHTVPYGIPMNAITSEAGSRSRPAGSPLRVIYTGRLVRRQKRALDIVRIARELDRRGVTFEMIVIGNGELRSEMEYHVHDLILRKKIWFVGSQPNDDILSLMPDCDAYLLPSSFEGLSVGMLEAMSRGVVPVVSDIRSGVPDVITHGVNGLIAPVADIGCFADHLEMLWLNPEENRRLSAEAAKTIATGYGIDRMVDSYAGIFRQIVDNPVDRPVGKIIPPRHLRQEIKWTTWASRVAADPMASCQRVMRRFRHS